MRQFFIVRQRVGSLIRRVHVYAKESGTGEWKEELYTVMFMIVFHEDSGETEVTLDETNEIEEILGSRIIS